MNLCHHCSFIYSCKYEKTSFRIKKYRANGSILNSFIRIRQICQAT